MADHESLLRGFFEPYVELSPDVIGFKDCECLFTHLENKEAVAER